MVRRHALVLVTDIAMTFIRMLARNTLVLLRVREATIDRLTLVGQTLAIVTIFALAL